MAGSGSIAIGHRCLASGRVNAYLSRAMKLTVHTEEMVEDRRSTPSKPSRAPSSTHLLKGLTDRPPSTGVAELLDTWSKLQKLAPDPDRAVGHIAQISGLQFDQVDHLRQVRNCCAHSEAGWPTEEDINRALITAYALRQLVLGI